MIDELLPWRSDAHGIPPEVSSRLERMEQAIDSIAVEIERISEGQRYTTKLLSDKARPYSDRPRIARRLSYFGG